MRHSVNIIILPTDHLSRYLTLQSTHSSSSRNTHVIIAIKKQKIRLPKIKTKQSLIKSNKFKLFFLTHYYYPHSFNTRAPHRPVFVKHLFHFATSLHKDNVPYCLRYRPEIFSPLEDSQTHFFMYCLCLLSPYKGRAEKLQQYITHKA